MPEKNLTVKDLLDFVNKLYEGGVSSGYDVMED